MTRYIGKRGTKEREKREKGKKGEKGSKGRKREAEEGQRMYGVHIRLVSFDLRFIYSTEMDCE